MRSIGGCITRLPVRFKSSERGNTEDGKHVATASTNVTVHGKLEALRSKRVVAFFRAKARQQAGVCSLAGIVDSSRSAVLSLLRSLRQLAVGFVSRKRVQLAAFESKWRRKLHVLLSVLTDERNLLSLLQKTVGRTFGRSTEKTQTERQQRVRIYRWVCQALARLGRAAVAVAHKRRRAEAATELAHGLVDRLLKEISMKLLALYDCERLTHHARVIQRQWRRVKSNEQAAMEAKARMLNLLTNFSAQIEGYQETQHEWLKTVHEASTNFILLCIRGAAQRLAARLVQRVWRGHVARKRVRRLVQWQRRRIQSRKQRERLREARALLEPSEMERRRRKQVETRTLARQQDTPLPVPRRVENRYQQRRGERVTLLEPLPVYSLPAASRTKVQCVPFRRFEKIVAQAAHVNLNNVWVAIPIGHHERQEEAGVRRGGGLSPLLVGRGRRRHKGGLQTTYDWVPARLLQSQEEIEATARRQRPTSSKNILKC